MTSPSLARSELDLPLVVTTLMKGVVYRDTHEKADGQVRDLMKRRRDTELNCPSMSSRKVPSADIDFTVSMPLIASSP